VRQAAIELLWEDESLSFMDELIRMVQEDDAINVRVEAAKALGRFVLLGELGDLPENRTVQAQDVLLQILNRSDEPAEIQCKALESVANCTRKDIIPLIQNAYNHDDSDFRVSAIVAMGHTCDRNRWQDTILKELETGDEDILQEAIRAAGEMQLDEAIQYIIEAIPDANREMTETIIWSLGEIGGKQAMRALEALSERAETEDDADLLAAIDDAISNASLASGDFALLDFTDSDSFDVEM
jgi:HEAT repeat protein